MISELKFRAAEPADLPFIIDLTVRDSVYAAGEVPADPASPHYRVALAAIDADPNQALYIAEHAGAPVGTFQLSFIPGLGHHSIWRGMIESVHVSPAHRNQGIGAAMMAFAIEACRAHGCGLVQLTSNLARKDAHRFYQRLGFAQTHGGFKLKL